VKVSVNYTVKFTDEWQEILNTIKCPDDIFDRPNMKQIFVDMLSLPTDEGQSAMFWNTFISKIYTNHSDHICLGPEYKGGEKEDPTFILSVY
jgi:hypothetical protein